MFSQSRCLPHRNEFAQRTRGGGRARSHWRWCPLRPGRSSLCARSFHGCWRAGLKPELGRTCKPANRGEGGRRASSNGRCRLRPAGNRNARFLRRQGAMLSLKEAVGTTKHQARQSRNQGSADFQSAVSPISNRQTATTVERARSATARRLEALRYSRLEICATGARKFAQAAKTFTDSSTKDTKSEEFAAATNALPHSDQPVPCWSSRPLRAGTPAVRSLTGCFVRSVS